MPSATTKVPTPTKYTTTTPTTVDRDIRDLPRRDDGQIELDAGVTAMRADVRPTEPDDEQAKLVEDVDVTGEIVNPEPIRDDPALSMQAGLIVDGVSFSP